MPVADLDLEVHPDALLEADAGLAWYLERSPRAAEHFLEEVERALKLILEAPERWPPHLYGTRRYVLYKFPYNVVYSVSGDLVRIYAIAHAKRRPGYWKSRLGWREPPM
jgi:plasmid stabilization system protein ParE